MNDIYRPRITITGKATKAEQPLAFYHCHVLIDDQELPVSALKLEFKPGEVVRATIELVPQAIEVDVDGAVVDLQRKVLVRGATA